MNFLKRAFTSSVPHSSSLSKNGLFLLRPTAQCSPYSTVYKLSNPPTYNSRTTQKAEEPSAASPRSSSSSKTFSQKVKERAEGLKDCPRPSEIPYQSKVANLVYLMGHVTTPVESRSAPNGESLAGAMLENNEPLVIPVVFKGDLASVAATHVKKNDHVSVVGKLSEDPLPFDLDRCQGNFHVVVESFNFAEEEKPFKKKNVGRTYPSKIPESEIDEPKLSQDSLNCSGAEEKDDLGNDPWKDLVKNPSEWQDYREQKSKGTVVPKHPDFKHIETRTPLWLNSAPKWVLPEIEKLFVISKETKVKEKKGEESWKDLVENPSKWWDNRLNKRSAKAPDFANKKTNEPLWLNSAPSWVLPKLPELKQR